MLENLRQNTDLQRGLGFLLALVAVGLIGWYISGNFSRHTSQENTENVIQSGNIGADIREGEGEIRQLPVDTVLTPSPQVTPPEIERDLVFPVGFDETAKGIIRNNVAQLVASLKENPDLLEAWSDLAVQYKIIEDYEGAAVIWEFLSTAAPQNTVSRVNLGHLYHYELKEYEKSEKNFKEAIEISKETVEAYLGLYELYRYSYQTGTAKAEMVLLDAMTAAPENLNVRIALAAYYGDTGRNAEAKALYQETRTIAEAQGNTGLVAQIDAALAAL